MESCVPREGLDGSAEFFTRGVEFTLVLSDEEIAPPGFELFARPALSFQDSGFPWGRPRRGHDWGNRVLFAGDGG